MTATTDAPTSSTGGAPTSHQGILAWVTEIAELTQPDAIHWCTGSDEEWAELTAALEATGTFTRLNPEIKPNSFHAASDPTDVARVEDRTFICSVDEKDCGPTNNWMDPNEMKDLMRGLYAGCMKGRTMYVIPFVMGHLEADSADVRRRGHRLGVRHGLHARHGPDGQPRCCARSRRSART